MRRAVVGAGVALMVGAGCRTWREHPRTAPDPSTVTHRLRMTTSDGARRLTLERATVRSDSIVGIVIDAEERRGDKWVSDATIAKGGQRAAVALADAGSLEARGTSWTRTAVLMAVVAGLLVLAAYAALAAAMSQPGY